MQKRPMKTLRGLQHNRESKVMKEGKEEKKLMQDLEAYCQGLRALDVMKEAHKVRKAKQKESGGKQSRKEARGKHEADTGTNGSRSPRRKEDQKAKKEQKERAQEKLQHERTKQKQSKKQSRKNGSC